MHHSMYLSDCVDKQFVEVLGFAGLKSMQCSDLPLILDDSVCTIEYVNVVIDPNGREIDTES